MPKIKAIPDDEADWKPKRKGKTRAAKEGRRFSMVVVVEGGGRRDRGSPKHRVARS